MYSEDIPHGRTASARTRVAVCAALLLTVLAPQTAAQSGGSIQGRVTASESGQPIAGVLIQVSPGDGGALTDAAGRYTVAALPAGTYQVTAQRLGHETARRSALVEPGSVRAIDFQLGEEAILLSSVVVSASREAQRLSRTSMAVGIVSRAELESARPTHPATVMSRIPGVWVSPTGGEGHTTAIRQPKTTNPVYLFLEDGVPTRSTGFFNHNALYEVNVPQAERIEVLKGPATALYGSDAIGGVINVETGRPSPGRRAEAFVESGAFGWNRLLASASGTRGDDGLRADVNLTRTSGWREATGYHRRSATLRCAGTGSSPAAR